MRFFPSFAEIGFRVAGIAGVSTREPIGLAGLPGQNLDACVVPTGKPCGTAADIAVFYTFLVFEAFHAIPGGITEQLHFNGNTVGVICVACGADVSTLFSCAWIPHRNACSVLADHSLTTIDVNHVARIFFLPAFCFLEAFHALSFSSAVELDSNGGAGIDGSVTRIADLPAGFFKAGSR